MDVFREFLLQNKELIGIVAQLATTVAAIGALYIIIASLGFIHEWHKHKKESELATFKSLDESYRNFLKLCLEHPNLQVYSYMSNPEQQFSNDEKIQRMILFDILVSLFESAFVQYKSHSTKIKEAQWSGWDSFIQDWCQREDFRIAWDEWLGKQFDVEFIDYMRKKMSA